MVQPTTTEFGVVSVILVVLFWVMRLATSLIESKMGVKKDRVCMDPVLRQQVKEVHDYTEGVQKKIASGEFKCAWNGRDEVRDFKEIMTRNAAATEALTRELRLTRNGRK